MVSAPEYKRILTYHLKNPNITPPPPKYENFADKVLQFFAYVPRAFWTIQHLKLH